MEKGISKNALEMHKLIVEAIDKHQIDRDDYDKIIEIALRDGTIDKHERAMLSQLQDLIGDKTIKIKKKVNKK
ncbi:hypothetical protein M0Q50_03605 [bacterium]|jgi:hypothetical protein|nr:hypothetical protein [bacterium]